MINAIFIVLLILLLVIGIQTSGILLAIEQIENDPFKITKASSLEEVNQKLEILRCKFIEENPDPKPRMVNDHVLSILSRFDYLENDLLSMAEEASHKEYYPFLKSLYPAKKIIWWNSPNDIVLLLAMAYGCEGWMSRKEWEEHSKDLDWRLHFRNLIRSNNKHIYENVRLMKHIFQNEIFWLNFEEITTEAYHSKNFAFLKTIPVPDPKIGLKLPDVFAFWAFSYQQEWGSDLWDEHVRENWCNGKLKLWTIFGVDNPKVFEFEPIKRLLEETGTFDNPLKIMLEYDSIAFARYLLGKYGPKQFKSMIRDFLSDPDAFNKMRTRRIMAPSEQFTAPVLSRVYNAFLENVLKLDITNIQFRDVAILEEKYLQPLLDLKFNKQPDDVMELVYLSTTKTGVEFLKKILNLEYEIDEELLRIFPIKLVQFGRAISDIELFHLIERRLMSSDGNSLQDERRTFRESCAKAAVKRGDVNFLVKASIHPPAKTLYRAALRGNLAAIDWVLKNDPQYFDDFTISAERYFTREYYPIFILRYFYKMSKSGEFLATYALVHLERAIQFRDKDHYDQVIAIEGVTEKIKEHVGAVPKF